MNRRRKIPKHGNTKSKVLILLLLLFIFWGIYSISNQSGVASQSVQPTQYDDSQSNCSEGQKLFEQGNYVDALPYLQKGVKERNQITTVRIDFIGGCEHALGKVYLHQDNFEGALENFLLALDEYRESEGKQKDVGILLYEIGETYKEQEQYLNAINSFQESADLAKANHFVQDEIASLIGMAAMQYALDDIDKFEKTLSSALTISGNNIDQTRNKIVHEIAPYELAKSLGQEVNNLQVYSSLSVDVDADGISETLMAGGQAEIMSLSTPGIFLIFDWEGEKLFNLKPINTEQQIQFQNLAVRDVNHDGKLEIVVLWRRTTSSVEIVPYIFSYDGRNIHSLLDINEPSLPMGAFDQGNIDFKDLNADGTDELLAWHSIWGAEDDSHWSNHFYMIDVYRWDGEQFVFKDQYKTREKYAPSFIVGRSIGMMGMPVDLGRHLRIESSRVEFERKMALGTVDTKFVAQLLTDSESFFNEKLFTEAEDLAELALQASSKLPDQDSANFFTAMALTERGFSRNGRGNFTESIEDINRTITLLEGLQKSTSLPEDMVTRELMRAYNNAGVFTLTSDPQASLAYLNRADEIANKIKDVECMSIASANIGHAYLFLRDFDLAKEHYLKALKWDQDLDRPFGRSVNLLGLGYIEFAYGKYENAIQYFEKGLVEAKNIGHIERAIDTYREIGRSYYELGNYEKALDNLQYSLLLSNSNYLLITQGLVYVYIGDVYAAMGDSQNAEKFYTKILTDFESGAESLSNPYGTFWRAHYGLAKLAMNKNQTDESLNQLKQAIEIIESQCNDITIESLSIQFTNDQLKLAVYNDIISLLYKQGQMEEVYNYVERARARAFLDELATKPINFRNKTDSEMLKQERALQNEIDDLEKKLEALRVLPKSEQDTDSILNLETELTAHQREYAELLTKIKLQNPDMVGLIKADITTLPELQKNLDTDTTLIEYYVMDSKTLIFIITHNTFKAIDVNVLREQLIEAITNFRDFASLGTQYPSSLQSLYSWLFSPIKKDVQTHFVGIIPHGILHYLSFVALTDGKAYLNDDYSIFTLPSASSLKYIQQKRKTSSGYVVLLGNPKTRESLPVLQFADKEVSTIGSLYGAKPLVGKLATESALVTQASGAGIIHIAAHGKYNPNNPLFGVIYLADDAQNDGKLELHEVYDLNLNLNTNLVVLSACQTDIGSISAGDEVMGLSRAFIYAGAPTVVASLWNVDDEATFMLMEKFYSYLRAGNKKGEALRQAQIDVRTKYPHPYYWASFVLTGDPEDVIQMQPPYQSKTVLPVIPMNFQVVLLVGLLLTFLTLGFILLKWTKKRK